MRSNPGKTVSIYQIAGLVNEAFLSDISPEDAFAPSLVSDRPNPELQPASTGPPSADDPDGPPPADDPDGPPPADDPGGPPPADDPPAADDPLADANPSTLRGPHG